MNATIAHVNRPIQHRFVSLFIGIDFIWCRVHKSVLLEFLIGKLYEVGPVGGGCVTVLVLAEGDVTGVDERAHGRKGACAQALGAE
jgi:hypothetical protein